VVVLAEGGGVQVGLMGMGGVIVVVTVGVVVVDDDDDGVVMVMQPDNVPIASKITSIREVTKSLIFTFFMAAYTTVYYSIIKMMLRNVNPLSINGEGVDDELYSQPLPCQI